MEGVIMSFANFIIVVKTSWKYVCITWPECWNQFLINRFRRLCLNVMRNIVIFSSTTKYLQSDNQPFSRNHWHKRMNVFFSIRMNSKQVIDELNNNNCIKLALERMDVVVDCLIWHIKLMYLRKKKNHLLSKWTNLCTCKWES